MIFNNIKVLNHRNLLPGSIFLIARRITNTEPKNELGNFISKQISELLYNSNTFDLNSMVVF
jgi:hypothetical protein